MNNNVIIVIFFIFCVWVKKYIKIDTNNSGKQYVPYELKLILKIDFIEINRTDNRNKVEEMALSINDRCFNTF